MSRCYISGPITGHPDGNRAAFAAEEAVLRLLGWHVVNPHALGLPDGLDWAEYMRADIKAMMECDAISMLPGWKTSRGAVLEHQIAVGLGFLVAGAGE